MHDRQPHQVPPAAPATGHDHPGSPAGEIDLGRAPRIGRRARLLAGLATGTAAAVLLALGTPDTGTSHSGPWPLG